MVNIFGIGFKQFFIGFKALFIVLFCSFRFPLPCVEVSDLVEGGGYICYTYLVFRVFFVYVPVDFDFLQMALFCMFYVPDLSEQFPKLVEVVRNIILREQILRIFPWQFFENFEGFFSVLSRFFSFLVFIKGPGERLVNFALLPDVRNIPWLCPEFFVQEVEGPEIGFFSFLDVSKFFVKIP